MIRMVIAEDHHLVRSGIVALLERESDIEVVAEAEDGMQALSAVEKHKPNVLVADVAMPGLNGIQVLEKVRQMQLPTEVVILSMYEDPALVRKALRGGARGYLLKRSVREELPLAIRAASRKQIYISPPISEGVLQETLGPEPVGWASNPVDLLSPREREVLLLIAEGHTSRAIANDLGVSVRTIEKHRARIRSKLGAGSVAELVRLAIRHGLLPEN